VSRAPGSANAQTVGFDLASGQVRWQRRLGVTPAGQPVTRGDGSAVVVDEDGAVYAVNPAAPAGLTAAATVLADVVAPPFADLTGKLVTTASPDGRTVWVLVPEVDRAGSRLRVRVVTDGALKIERTVPLPKPPAGDPVPLGNAVLIPLADGYVYRYTPGDSRLSAGPFWGGAVGDAEATCFLTPLGADEFLATDGNRKFLHWRWPVGPGAQAAKVAGPWEVKAKFAVPPAVVRPDRIVAADVTGAVLLFPADRPADAVRRWRGDGEVIPAGLPTDRFRVLSAGGKEWVVYPIDRRHLVALDPERDEPVWVARDLIPADAGELAGWGIDSGRVIATGQTGRVAVLDAFTGRPIAVVSPPVAGTVAVGPAVPLVPGEGLMVLADGSAATVPLPPRPEPGN
jgi:outer membrane protein assembly factor BamB